MLECPECGGRVPEVEGVDEQVCPTCGHRFLPARDAAVATGSGISAARGPPSPGEMLGRAWRAYRAAPGAALALWVLPVLVGVAVGALLPTPQQIQHLTDQANAANLTVAQQEALLGKMAGLLGTIVGLLVALGTVVGVAMAATVALADAHRRGERPALGDAGRALASHPGAILATSVGLAVLTVLGLVFFILPALLVVHWFLFAPSRAGEGAGFRSALGGSRRLVRARGTLGYTFFVVGLVLLFDIAAGLVQSVAAVAPVAQVDLLTAAVGAVANWLLAPVIPLFMSLAYLELRDVPERSPRSPWAAEEAAGGGATSAPTPSSAASPRAAADTPAPGGREFHTATCPDCGTIVPFYVEEDETRVVCPTCGKVGYVRRNAGDA